MNNTISEQTLNNVDNLIIEELNALPLDTWDFKGMDTKSLTHGIHNYPAVMVYPISRKLISIIKKYQPIETFLDPFMGSGTTLVESVLADLKKVYGSDLNPLARIISETKTKPISANVLNKEITTLFERIDYNFNELNEVIENIDYFIKEEKGLDVTSKDGWGNNAYELIMEYLHNHKIDLNIPNVSNLGYWFLPNVILKLQIIKNCIKLTSNKDVRNFFWVGFSETVRLSSNRRNGEFKMFRMPAEKVKSFNPNVLEIFMNIIVKNEQKMLEYEKEYNKKKIPTNIYILNNDAMSLDNVPDSTIDLMITSPPYGDSRTTVAYGQFSRTALEWLDLYQDFNEEKITEKDIRNIDKKLLGGKPNKENIFELNSPTLKETYHKIKTIDNKRAIDVYAFYKDLDKSIATITKKMKVNSYQCWVVGNRTVKEEKLLTHQILIELGQKYNLKHVITLSRNIPNKVMPSLNSPTNKTGKKLTTMTNEHIVILRKEK